MANYQAGVNAKIRINTVAYATATYQISDEAPEQDVSNTEGIGGNPLVASNVPGFTSVIGALQRFTATIRNATFDVLANPFAAPYSLVSRTFIALRVFLNGAGGVSWQSVSFYVARTGQDQDVHALQPISFSGVGDGSYSVPSA